MGRYAKAKSNKSEKKQETPAVVYFWAIGMGFLFYIVARVVLAAYPHPYHWLAMLIGAVIGVFCGWVWFRWRGDVF